MDHKITLVSPFVHSPGAEEYGKGVVWQAGLLEDALDKVLSDPFEQGRDLRGREIRLTLHEDGLHVTAEIVKAA